VRARGIGIFVWLCLAQAGCFPQHPIMVLPDTLRADADVMIVSGREGVVLWNPAVEFGPFRTVSLHRGWRSDSSTSWALLDSSDSWTAKYPFSFVLEGPGSERWNAGCTGYAERTHRQKAVGLGSKDNGDFGILRRTVAFTAYEVFECTFDGPAGRRSRLLMSDVDESGFGGVLIDEQNVVLARVRRTDKQIGKPYEYTVPSPLGFYVETNTGLHVAVERAFKGKVVFSRATPRDQATPLAALATALLVWTPLR
jgi:hypothetical protein